MVKLLLLVSILFVYSLPSFSQKDNSRVLFSHALSIHLDNYKKQAKAAYYDQDYVEVQRLYDSLVEYNLSNTFMDDFKFRKIDSKEKSLYDFIKPVYLITYASWCVFSEGEIPAINALAAEYSDRIDFVIIFWDDRKTTKKMAKKYNDHVKVLYVNELENKHSHVISQLKHSLGLPTTFIIDGNKKILDIKRGFTHPYGKSLEESFALNYNFIYEGIANHLLSGEKDSSLGKVASF